MMSPIVSWVLQLVLGFVLAVLAGVLAAWIFKVLQKPSSEKRFRLLLLVFVIVFGLVLIALIVVLAPRFPPAVPNLVDLGLDQAQRMAEDRGVSLSVNRQYMVIPEKDRVARQDPPAGTRIAKGGKIAVTVSAGPYPQVVGMEEAVAVAALLRAGLTPKIERLPSLTFERGVVAQQKPENGEDVRPGDEVTIIISRGPDEPPIFEVPTIRTGDASVTIRVGGFPPGSTVLGWLKEPGDNYYCQGEDSLQAPGNPDVIEPRECRLTLFKVHESQEFLVTVHPPGAPVPPLGFQFPGNGNLLRKLEKGGWQAPDGYYGPVPVQGAAQPVTGGDH